MALEMKLWLLLLFAFIPSCLCELPFTRFSHFEVTVYVTTADEYLAGTDMNIKIGFGFHAAEWCPGYCPDSPSYCRWLYMSTPTSVGKKIIYPNPSGWNSCTDEFERGRLDNVRVRKENFDQDAFNLIEKACLEYARGNMTYYMDCFIPTYLLFQPSWDENDWWFVRRDVAWKYSKIKVYIEVYLRKPHPGIKKDKLVMSRTFYNPGHLWLDPYSKDKNALFMVCNNAEKSSSTTYMKPFSVLPSSGLTQCCNLRQKYIY
ncbi:hypothetical protein L596_025530 [Steinernema carpocapsae]|uniref:Uncharacterized protein n=1 Tax=Steinernema carpocapsae TaxID=34508 RepID=A0A4U5M807_STECR|nr:hypothetical protein L596_025530 [Steinernema carpocapsae]